MIGFLNFGDNSDSTRKSNNKHNRKTNKLFVKSSTMNNHYLHTSNNSVAHNSSTIHESFHQDNNNMSNNSDTKQNIDSHPILRDMKPRLSGFMR